MVAEESKFDWIYLPAGVEQRSLWACLHDAKLVEIRSDALGRTVTLKFKSPHLLNSDIGLHFLFHFGGVTSVHAVVWRCWPGAFQPPAGITREEHSQLVEEYQAKGREETLSWKDLEASVNAEFLDVMEAHWVTSQAQIALQIKGRLLDEDVWCQLSLRGDAFTVTRSDGEPFSLEEFIAIGEEYWDKFALRRTA